MRKSLLDDGHKNRQTTRLQENLDDTQSTTSITSAGKEPSIKHIIQNQKIGDLEKVLRLTESLGKNTLYSAQIT